MGRIRLGAAALLAATTAACVPRAAPPAPVPTPRPAPSPSPPVPAPAPTPPPTNWLNAPLSPGDWRYRQDGEGRTAIFQSDAASFSVRCGGGSVELSVANSWGAALYVNTSYGDRRLAAAPTDMNHVAVSLAATDPLLDQIAFSRGRFLVQVEGGARLILPSWPEIARVVEDCRGA